MTGLSRNILNWCDKKFEEGCEEDNLKKVNVSGFVEGLVDGAVLMYVPLVIACFIWKKKATKK